MWYHTQRAIEAPCTFSQGFLSKIVYSFPFLLPFSFLPSNSSPHHLTSFLPFFSPFLPLNLHLAYLLVTSLAWTFDYHPLKDQNIFSTIFAWNAPKTSIPSFLFPFHLPFYFFLPFSILACLLSFITHISFFVLNTQFETFQQKIYY